MNAAKKATRLSNKALAQFTKTRDQLATANAHYVAAANAHAEAARDARQRAVEQDSASIRMSMAKSTNDKVLAKLDELLGAA